MGGQIARLKAKTRTERKAAHSRDRDQTMRAERGEVVDTGKAGREGETLASEREKTQSVAKGKTPKKHTVDDASNREERLRKKWRESAAAQQQGAAPAGQGALSAKEMDDGAEVLAVERVVDAEWRPNGLFFRLKWCGYEDPRDDSSRQCSRSGERYRSGYRHRPTTHARETGERSSLRRRPHILGGENG
jgi:hypothetical protein